EFTHWSHVVLCSTTGRNDHSLCTIANTGMALNWDDGRLFLAVARAGQLLGAARNLGLNQATLGRRITSLERTIGAKLLVRRTTGCELTEEGRALVQSLERIESDFLQSEAQLSGKTASLFGTI